MNFVKLVLTIVSCTLVLLQMVSCQFDDFPSFFNEFRESLQQADRDPRENRGPVVFPSAPIPPDTSGVRVGASGFGFVPPNSQRSVGPVLGALSGPHADDFPFW